MRNSLTEYANLDCDVVVKIPKERKPEFILVDSSTPRRATLASTETLIICYIYAESHQRAWQISEKLETALEKLYWADDRILGWHLISPGHEHADPDRPATKRWQLTGMLTQAVH